ncbi:MULTISPECIES: dihydrodipicolinate synthase family protein [Paracoccus]|uniref:4-hydroxy-tetrahydrodipicolinate synthase n=1 Tax=Paracoccus pantotrophus TaxID=82367 RepID=A0AAE6NYR2_PARPN|nr:MULTISPECIES: dihydrodipicolinate synthase family protein [Paracoccus]QFG37578.1 dihydrodipicolinate synthase family protein [Paracoccus pantotrophus]RKS51965.1 4-hydroxy-tetrahydrodipicolinate synthase [Paracoccus pantotrophus]UFM64110.1 dihydrodipicolinate synthase family protein [Paracoccus sp. MA]SMG50195.1 4-hydroxy-tetrahydrodipicolinate synthase [Paracoccus sp. J56]
MSFAIEGVYCAAATPLKADGTPDLPLFGAHAKALIEEGCHGIAMLGSTGEANSFSVRERMDLLEAAIAGGTRPDQMLPGTSSCAVTDAVELTRHAVQAGVKGVVLLPPFYYTAFSDESLFRFYASIIEKVADDRLKVILYHIPMLTGVPISHELIAMLVEAFPDTVIGIKDSDGKIENMHAMAARFPGFAVLAGADPLLLPVLQGGGAGCITASSNLVARELRVVYDHWNDPAKAAEVKAAQDVIVAWRNLTNSYTQLPTVKTMLARRRGDMGWMNVHPPFSPLSEGEAAKVWAVMDELESKA